MGEKRGTLTATGQRDAERGHEAPALYRVLECSRPLEPGARLSLAGVGEVLLGRGTGGVSLSGNPPARRLTVELDDRWMSTGHARLERRLSWVLVDTGSKNGAIVNGARVGEAVLADGDVVELGRTFFLFRDSVPITGPVAGPTEPVAGMPTLVPEFAAALRQLTEAAPTRMSIVLHGESGVGKELAARAAHALSGRRGDLVAVNCAALPDSLIESELFGYRRGAFSGAADDRLGLVRAADGGTLFLDEIGDLREASQAALLRVLQENEVTPLGATRPVSVDVRVVAATHHDLAARVSAHRFRRDLYMRLAGFQLDLPAVRDRREDLGLLTAAILRRLTRDPVTLHPTLVRAFFAHPFSGNVRELERCLAAAVVFAKDGPVELSHAPAWFRDALAGNAGEVQTEEERARREEIVLLLKQHGGNITAVARAMGKARTQVQRWIKRYQIDPKG